jgi:hypothetical protein
MAHDITIQLDGAISASENWKEWPVSISTGPYGCEVDDFCEEVSDKKMDLWTFVECQNIKIYGKG